MERLILFTQSFPYGTGENWIQNELESISIRFSVRIVPLYYEGAAMYNRKLPANVEVEKPLFNNLTFRLRINCIFDLLSRNIGLYLREMAEQKVLFSKDRIVKFFFHLRLERRLLNHPVISKLFHVQNEPSIWYFFWGLGVSQIIPVLKPSAKRLIAVRMHGYDLYEYRNNGYIPFRKFLLNRSDLILPVSENGRHHLVQMYPENAFKVKVSRLGTITAGLSSFSTDAVLRIFSCSSLIPLKRVCLIAEALTLITEFKVEWSHLGDGPERKRIDTIIANKSDNISVTFLGSVKFDEIAKIYARSNIDLFIHVSETEGVPVAIMEAFASGIPVMATNVGGVGEIVDDSVGKLLPPVLSACDLKHFLMWFYYLPQEEKFDFRNKAYHRYLERCSAVVQSKKLEDMFEKSILQKSTSKTDK